MDITSSTRVAFRKESWALRSPFRFAGYTVAASDVVTVELSRDGVIGRGEATGVIYHGETPDTICAQIANVVSHLEHGADRDKLRGLLPAGGARNAVDCALWDLECKESSESIWQKLGLSPKTVTTVNTIGLDDIASAVQRAVDIVDYPILKVKLDRDDPVRRLRLIRAARTDARIIVDANQSWDIGILREVAEPLRELGVEMIEQPLPAGDDDALTDFESPIPLCADESCFVAGDIAALSNRYGMVNIKLDKCGGLTEALDMVRLAQANGLELMVGNMIGTSLSMAPSYVIAQFCTMTDLDGPLALVCDRSDGLRYERGTVSLPSRALWG